MEKIGKFFFIILGLLAIASFISQFAKLGTGIPIMAWGLIIVACIIAAYIIRERVRFKKEGYYVRMRGEAKDGYVLYNEGEKTLRLYFSRLKDTVYVPSDAKWKEIMPSWARERKAEIMGRIKKHVGKRLIGTGWKYEESDEAQTLIVQK